MLRVAFGTVTGVMFSGCLPPGAEEPLLRELRLLIQGALLVIATSFALVNLVVDVLYAALDPRIRLG